MSKEQADQRPKLPPIPQKMLDILLDGEEHQIDELKECLLDNDDLVPDTNVQFHLNILRRHLMFEGKGLYMCKQKQKEKARYRIVHFVTKGGVGKLV